MMAMYEEYMGKDWTAGTFLQKETGEVIQLRKMEDTKGTIVNGEFVYDEDKTCEAHYHPLPSSIQMWNQTRLADQSDYSYGCQRGAYEALQREYYRLQMRLAHPDWTKWYIWEEDGCTDTVCELSIIETINNASDIYEWRDA